ncbi:MAG: M3 family metallopeptidase [Paludibacteraceae bacterium]|nr:M3 family metallopeptidase [Paludibacteraceae bacterium]
MNDNVFLISEYSTPHGTFPFDKLKLSDYLPAVKEGIRLHDAEIDAIVKNPEAPTFENTIVALERSGSLLSRVQYIFYNLLEAETCAEMDSLSEEISPLETEHSNNVSLNADLFKRVKAVYEQKDALELTPEQNMLLVKTYESFEKNGANLSDEGKEKFRELSKRLSLLTLKYGQNVLNATNAYKLNVKDSSDLAGLPSAVVEAAAKKAKDSQMEGWVFDLTYPSYAPFMKYAQKRELREQLYMAYNTKAASGEFDNRQVVKDIVNTRLELSKLMGSNDYAERVLRYRMAENKENVYHLLNELLEAYKPTAMKEMEEVQAYAKAHGADFDIMPWDWSFYSEKLRDEKYSINDELLRPYFELENVKRGVFGLATKLYGLTFQKNDSIPVYHEEVEAFDVFDKDGSFLAVLYTDFHPRDGKRGGAWMTEFLCQHVDEKGVNVRPHISIVMNFTRPTDSLPSLLTFDELTTFIHEFGHSIHGMVANSHYESLAGTNVYRDFVELPSQMLENWAFEKEYLDGFAVHYKTGEPIPAELIEKIRRAANFNIGYATLRQLSFGLLDMGWHTITEPFEGDVKAFESKAWSAAQTLPTVEEALMSTQFNHIFSGGYSAGYYSYKWAEVLDADAFFVFEKNGIFDQETATRFRKEVLERGGSEHPMVLYKRFRGEEPSILPLLRRHGIRK